MTRVKICGITTLADLEHCIEAGADYIGIVREPSSPRYVENPMPLVEFAAGKVPVVGVYGPLRDDLYLQVFDVIQTITPACLPNLLLVIRVGEPGGDNSVDCAAQAILLDAYHPAAYGGSGTTVDLGAAAEIVKSRTEPVILAGGLTPENVGDAIRSVRPFGVDVSSGVEMKPGRKDPEKVAAFISAVRSV